MSVRLSVLLHRDPAGVLAASLGIEPLPVRCAPGCELARHQNSSHDDEALRLVSLFGLLGCQMPFDPSGMELLGVFHHGLDLGKVRFQEPGNTDGPYWLASADGRVVFHGGAYAN